MNVSTPMLNRTEVWGIIALTPLILTLIISLLFHFSLQPLKQLYNQIKEEKNILIFLLYGILPVALWMGFDEIDRPLLFIYPILLTIITVATIILYLESQNKTHRNLILIFGTIIPIIIATIGIINLF
jgi:glucose uptake protein GlcU